MCAIAGLIGLPFDMDILESMQQTMSRRGPDDKGMYCEGDCALLHARLTIIDPEGGAQPMLLEWEGERYVIVYNGELYNTKEIADELVRCGHRFAGHSDTEIVLHAYAQWQEKCLDYFNGIFAFAVWHVSRRKLFIARDRMGVKPCFYKLHEKGFLFASEIKTILQYPTVSARLDEQGAAELLLLGPGRMPGSGVLCGIMELEPGCCGVYENGSFHWKRYWFLKDAEHNDSLEETAEKVRFLVLDSIQRQMISDMPLGTFLSGGLDSSIISAVCANRMQETGQVLNTFSVDYENNDKYFIPGKFQPNSDNSYIEIMLQTIHSNHHWTVLSPDMLVNALEDAVRARDLPGMADVDSSLLLFSKEIRKHVKVALSGECADEIFGGYPWYRDPQVLSFNGFPWAQNTKQRALLLNPDLLKRIKPVDFIMSAYERTIHDCDILPDTPKTERRIKEMVNLNHRWFMQTLLDRKDRMSMYNGLEVRVPFCDYRIAQYLYTVPWEFKEYGGKEKGLLRYAMKDILPEEVLWRKKSPYPKTHDPRYEKLVFAVLADILQDSTQPIHQMINTENLKAFLQEEQTWPWYGQLMRKPQTAAYMVMLNMWLKINNVSIV